MQKSQLTKHTQMDNVEMEHVSYKKKSHRAVKCIRSPSFSSL